MNKLFLGLFLLSGAASASEGAGNSVSNESVRDRLALASVVCVYRCPSCKEEWSTPAGYSWHFERRNAKIKKLTNFESEILHDEGEFVNPSCIVRRKKHNDIFSENAVRIVVPNDPMQIPSSIKLSLLTQENEGTSRPWWKKIFRRR